MKVVLQLLTPARYIRVRSDGGEKLWIDFGFPLLVSVAVTALWAWRPDVLSMSGGTGLISGVAGLMQILVGFYVATLAAIATFPASSLDESTNRMTLKGEPLLRRRFLAYLFGHLALLSIVLIVGMLFRPLAEALVFQVGGARVQFWLKFGFVLAYQFVFWQMIFVTLLGLHYLTDRIHRSNTD